MDEFVYSESEDEFTAAPDSGDDDMVQGSRGMQLGNVVVELPEHGGGGYGTGPPVGAQPLQLPTFEFASKRHQRLDHRVLLLFDINGVLMQHRWNGVSHQHDLRPGVHHLLRLVPHFRLGVFSSATRPTITKALSKLHNNLANFLDQRSRQAASKAAAAVAAAGAGSGGGGRRKRKLSAAAMEAAGEEPATEAAAGGHPAGAGGGAGAAVGVDADGFPTELPPSLFEVVMARDHCQPATPEEIAARGGRPWDTVKPLGKYFAGLGRVILVDDSAHKAASGEGANMLIMPCWPGAAHPLGRADGSLLLLVNLLLSHAGPGAAAAPPAAASAAAAAAASGGMQDGRQASASATRAQSGAELANGEANGDDSAAVAAEALDIRRVTAVISQRLAEAAARQLQEAQATGMLSSEEAAAASAVVEAAVAGSAAVAAAAATVGGAQGGGQQQQQQQQQSQQPQQQPQQQQQGKGTKRQQPDATAAAAALAGRPAAANAAAPARLSKKQRKSLAAGQEAAQAGLEQQAAARVLVLAAVAALESSGSADGGASRDAKLANINDYLKLNSQRFFAVLFNKTAKQAAVAAATEGLLQARTEAAAGGATYYCLTPAGEAAMGSEQCVADVALYCSQFATWKELVAALQSQQAQQAQQAQHQVAASADCAPPDQGGDVPGFFWERQQPAHAAQAGAEQQQQQQGQEPASADGMQHAQQAQQAAAASGGEQPVLPAQATAPAPSGQLPPALAGADLASLQRAVLLRAVCRMQQRSGVPVSGLELWAGQQMQPACPALAQLASGPGKALGRKLRQVLQLALRQCQQEGLVTVDGLSDTVDGLGDITPPSLQLCSLTPAGHASAPGAADVTASVALLAKVLAGSGTAAAGATERQTGEACQPAAAIAAAAAAAAAAQPAAAGDAAGDAAQDCNMPDAAAAEAAAEGGSEAVPLLLEVFEDVAQAPMPAPRAATAVVQESAAQPAGASAAQAQQQSQQQAQQAQQQQSQQQAQEQAQEQAQQAQQAAVGDEEARERRQEQADLKAAIPHMPKAERHRQRAVLRTAEVSNLPLAHLHTLGTKNLRKVRKRAVKQARNTGRKSAAAALDGLFAAATSGSDAAWQAACAGLCVQERALLQKKGVDLEQYRRLVSKGQVREGAQEDEGGSSSSEEEEQIEEAANTAGTAGAAGAEITVEAAIAAHGGHYLRSCDSPAAAAAAAAGAGASGPTAAPGSSSQWFWEQLPSVARQPSQPSQQPMQQPMQQRQQQMSPLHYEVEAFASRATPTLQEAEAVKSAARAISEAARSLWPHSRTALFGSQATGLALPGSDLDIVVLNVGATLARAGSGFTHVQRKQLSELLEDLLDAMLQRRLLRGKAQIIEAKVPIIKCRLEFGNGLAADISLGAENGAHAVDYVRRQVLAVPPLRPLCLAVKAFLRERGQNEVFTGGLSSYSVFNMVMAHLQCEGYCPAPDTSSQAAAAEGQAAGGGRGFGRGGFGRGWGGRGGGRGGRGSGRPQGAPFQQQQQQRLPADLSETLTFLSQLASGALPALCQAAAATLEASKQRNGGGHLRFLMDSDAEEAEAGVEAAAAGAEGSVAAAEHRPPADLGVLLWGFFDRFGTHFSYSKHAVSIRMGGVCNKLKAWRNSKRPWLLAVEDPQEMGKDIGSGSASIKDIKGCFAQAAELLAEVCEDLDANQAAEEAAGAAEAAAGLVQAPSSSHQLPAGALQRQQQQQQQAGQQAGQQGGKGQLLLGGVLNVEAAVGRSSEAARARAAMEAKAAAKSSAMVHHRIRAGVAVGRSLKPSGKQLARSNKQAVKAERLAQSEASYRGGKANREKRLGSRRTAAVEAQWGSQRGSYKDYAEDDGPAWSLRKQKKPKTPKAGKQGQQQQGQQQQQQQSAKKKKQRSKRGQQEGGSGSGGGSAKKKVRY